MSGFIGCNSESGNNSPKPPQDSNCYSYTIENGIEIDSITIDYAGMKIGTDGYPVIRKITPDNMGASGKVLLYFEFHSKSRDDLNEHYRKLNEEYEKKGYTADWCLPYKDGLTNVTVKMKLNEGDFNIVEESAHPFVYFPVPQIENGNGFALYELTESELIADFHYRFLDQFIINLTKTFEPGTTAEFEVKFTFSDTSFTLRSELLAF